MLVLLTALVFAQEPVDLSLALPEGRTVTWTHLVRSSETSHWGDTVVQAVVLSHQEVERGGVVGVDRLEWIDVVDDLALELQIADRPVQTWEQGASATRTDDLQRFEAMADTSWRTYLHRDGTREWYQTRVQHRYPSDAPGPQPPELFSWFYGMGIGGLEAPEGGSAAWGAFVPGVARSLYANVPVWGVGVARCAVEVTVDEVALRRAHLSYTLEGVGFPPARDGLTMEALTGHGSAVVELARGRVVEHQHDLDLTLRRGGRTLTRHDEIASFLNRVRRRPPRHPRRISEP